MVNMKSFFKLMINDFNDIHMIQNVGAIFKTIGDK